MKMNDKNLVCLLIVTVLLFVLTASCTKNEPTITSVPDIDNNVYNVVEIGRQVWMQENLKVTRYRNGDLIGSTVPGTKDITNESNPKYQWPAYNSESNVEIFGRLYTWYAVTDRREICPVGWHVPTHHEWTDLVNYLGGIDSAGGKLKETGTTHWVFPNSGATNESGFNAIPGGYRNPDGTFYRYPGRNDVWWSSTSTSTLKALHWGVGYIYSYFYLCEEYRSQAVSVRCLKD